MKRISKLWLFLLVTFFINFTMVGVFLLLGGEFKGLQGMLLGATYMFVPMLSVLIVEKFVYKEKVRVSLNISFKVNTWFLAALLIPVLLVFMAMVMSLLLPNVSFSPDMAGLFKRYQDTLTPEQVEQMKLSFKLMPIHPVFLTLLQGIIAGLTVNALAGFGEELAWRGFLLKELKGWSFIKVSIVVGAIWGFWHSPLILLGHNYPQHPQLGVVMMIAWCVLLAFLFNYVTVKSRSVIAAAVMHGVLNGTAGVSIMVIDGGTDLLVGVTGLAGLLSLVVLILVVYWYDRWFTKEKVMSKTLSETLFFEGKVGVT